MWWLVQYVLPLVMELFNAILLIPISSPFSLFLISYNVGSREL